MAARFELNDASVIVVVGSGAGGGTLANELCQKGHKVVCLEAGNHLTLNDYVNDEITMWGKLTWQDPRTGQPIWIVKAVGGSTNHWAGLSIRFKDYELKPRTTYGDVAGANLIDWPVTLRELEPYYDMAEIKMGVTGTHGHPRHPDTNAFKVVNYCAKKAGYSFEMGPSAINSIARDGRPACQMIGFCTSGCKIGAKWSTLYTEVPRAMATGRFELRPNSMVLQIQHDVNGKVTGVLYADKDGKHQVQKARIVCVAGNSIESPRLLLNSASSMFPDGMANSSGQVGRNYTRHATQHMYATFEKPVNAHRGIHAPSIMRSEARHDTSRGFAGGYYLEIFDVGLPFTALSIVPGEWGRKVSGLIEQFNHMVAVWTCGEDMPQAKARVTLDNSTKDQYGLPIPNIAVVEDLPNDAAMKKHARTTLESIFNAGNARDIAWRPPFPNS
ncbi:MAG: GMC family oxidoreductase N-terminal domain-containing protein, partial [Xanthomonadales bacterium]|nr:GMC family oxidoreductase N-terminal domain-containing protein [Xanthomonadales bacterium]